MRPHLDRSRGNRKQAPRFASIKRDWRQSIRDVERTASASDAAQALSAGERGRLAVKALAVRDIEQDARRADSEEGRQVGIRRHQGDGEVVYPDQ
eukprot:4058745-Prymnesium_polylepis.1